MRAGGVTDAHLCWSVFAAVMLCGAGTAMQAIRFGRFGSGHALAMCSPAASVWPCIAALEMGGVGLLVTLVIVSALIQFLVSARVAALRRVLTPTISGTVLMLVPVTAMPIVFAMLATQTDVGTSKHETSMRMLRQLATSVPHHQFHDVDIATVRADAQP